MVVKHIFKIIFYKKYLPSFMKGHFHLAQISSTQIYKFEPCGNVPCNWSEKNIQPCLMFAYLENESM